MFLEPLPQFLGRPTLVRPQLGRECHQAEINALDFLLAVFALELPNSNPL